MVQEAVSSLKEVRLCGCVDACPLGRCHELLQRRTLGAVEVAVKVDWSAKIAGSGLLEAGGLARVGVRC